MRRREFIAGLGGAAVWPLAVRAQLGERMRRIGMLWPFAEVDPEANAWLATFREELEKLGWVEGRNVRIDHRWAALDEESVQRFARELVALRPDIILTQSTPNTVALLQQTRTIPIVFTQGTDPVGAGFVASLSRPGGNVTGFINLEASLGSKAHLLLIYGRVGTSLTRQLFEAYMIGEKDGRASQAFCRCVFPAEPATPAALYSHRLRDQNPPRRPHKSNMLSIVATHS